MDKLKAKRTQLLKALKSLEISITIFNRLKTTIPTFLQNEDTAEEYRIHRDSVVQRFEYSIDLFWKFIKNYLESAHILSGIKIPSEVIREAYSLRLINEDEAETILEMIKNRNMTSHIYIEEIAEQLVQKIPAFYSTMHNVAQRFKEPGI